MHKEAICHNFPTLNLEHFSGYNKIYEAFRFLPIAIEYISSKKLRLKRTFHISNRYDRVVGLSDGDFIYPTSKKDINKISNLLIVLEDQRFFNHSGIDPKGICRSILRNILAGKIVQGGSTITQQLVRNTLLSCDPSFIRKLIEIILSLFIEKYYSKKEILHLYCQYVYLGGGVRGFDAAAKFLYRKPLTSLGFEQLCGLLCLLRSPSLTYPKNSIEKFNSRQKLIIQIISKRTPIQDCKTHLSGRHLNPINIESAKKPRLTRIVEHLAERQFGDIRQNIKKVTLTIDTKIQRILDYILRDASLDLNVSEISCIILNNKNREILAESAWREGVESHFSPSYFGSIQPGSTFKTFALLSALEQGFNSELKLKSSPFESSFIRDSKHNLWKVRNYAYEYRGSLTLREALIHSDNTVFARLAELLDLKKLSSTFARFGLSTKSESYYPMVLGATHTGISLLQLASAYMAIARNGVFSEPQLIKFIELDNAPRLLRPRCPQDVIIADYGLVKELKLALRKSGFSINGIAFSGKTGTTKTGSLFSGYNDNVSLAIWIGHKRTPSEKNPKAITAKMVLERFARKMLGYRSDFFTI